MYIYSSGVCVLHEEGHGALKCKEEKHTHRAGIK